MRTTTYTGGGVSATIVYPEDMIFGFNPNYIEFRNVTGAKFVRLGSGKHEFDVELYNGEAKADISLLIQTRFTDPRRERTKDILVDVMFDGSPATVTNVVFRAIWGSTSIGERLNAIGAYHFDKSRGTFVRNVRWFTHFPQKLSVYNNRTFEDFYPTQDEYVYDLDSTSVDKIAIFDHTFDETFIKTFSIASYHDARIILHRDATKDGYFLRWMDNLGMYQYFLFLYNETSEKNTQKHELQEEIEVDGRYFGGGVRMLTHENERTLTASAMHLTREEILYVKTIVNSPFVDMYQGTMQGGTELWVPVRITDGERKYSEKKELNDFEIKFVVPTSRPQQL